LKNSPKPPFFNPLTQSDNESFFTIGKGAGGKGAGLYETILPRNNFYPFSFSKSTKQ